MKLKSILKEILKSRSKPYGEFIRTDFYEGIIHVGYINVKLKKGWNQLHIEVFPEYQNKGYAKQFIEQALAKYKYVTAPEGRITNPNIIKVIGKFEDDPKFEVFKTEYDEWVISNASIPKAQIIDKLG